MTAVLTHARLLEVLDYNPDTGVFVWKPRSDTKRTWNTKNAGKVAGSLGNKGYLRISIDKKRYLSHMLAWFMVHGQWPERFVDHKNLNKLDNSADNLRLATFGENSANAGIRADNTSGFRGVTYERRRKRWIARIMSNGRYRQVGSFKEPHLAAQAYAKAAVETYGEFCPQYIRALAK